MRITILQGAFLPVPPLRGGAVEKLWFELGKQFSLLGHSVCHVSRSFPGLPPDEIIDGVHHLRLKGHDTPSNGLYLKILDLLYSFRAIDLLPPADILITNTFWMPILSGRRQDYFGKLVVSVERMPKGQMRLYRRASCLRAPSHAVANAITHEAPHLTNIVRIIPNPLPLLPSQFPTNQHSRVILYCGRLHPEKGIDLLINAFSQACHRGLSGWTLRLVGPADTAAGGGGLSWLQGILNSGTTQDLPIEWLGPIYDDKMLLQIYSNSAIFVYPSLAEHGEAMPIAPLEAMACGAVPIVSDLACFRDFINPGINGIVFDHRSLEAASLLADVILDLTGNPINCEVMSKEATSVLVSHHPSVIADKFIRLFEQLL